jgi:hypothetical protein
MLHVLPSGIKRIRHYGVLASSCKGTKLNAVRLALQMPGINQQALESAQKFKARVARVDVGLCPVCKVGHWRTVEVLAGATVSNGHGDEISGGLYAAQKLGCLGQPGAALGVDWMVCQETCAAVPL